MSKFTYHHRVRANMPFNPTMVRNKPTDPSLMRFNELIWYGRDDEGNCVYRRDSFTGEVVRIDFY